MLETPAPPARWPLVVAVLLLFTALGPLLSKAQFARTLENLNIQTAIEARRDGHWMVPTLEAAPRTKKPPLTAWITALSMRPTTVANLSNRNAAIRALSFRELAWEARWPALLQMGLALVAVFVLARSLGVAGESALLCAATYLFIRYAQVALTDTSLTLWVITANAMFALAVFEKRRWIGALGTGVALGLAFMSKGPVSFCQAALPWLIWAVWLRRSWKGVAGPLLLAILAFLAIATPWYLIALIKNPHGQWHTWFKEVTGGDSPERRTPIYWYLTFLPEFMPALLFAIPGVIVAFREGRRRPQLMLMVLLVVVPFVIQSFFKNKSDRYILPLVGPMAVLAAVGLRECCTKWRSIPAAALYWFVLAGIAIALAVLGALGWPKALRGADGHPWFAWPLAASAIAVAGVLLLSTWRNHRWQSPRVALFTLMFMLLIMHLLTLGYYGRSVAGQSHMHALAEQIWAEYPDAQLYTTEPYGRRASEDLSIYTARLTGWITVEEMTRATPGDRPKVVLIREDRGLTPLPPIWKDLRYLPKEAGETWRAVVLPSQNPSTP